MLTDGGTVEGALGNADDVDGLSVGEIVGNVELNVVADEGKVVVGDRVVMVGVVVEADVGNIVESKVGEILFNGKVVGTLVGFTRGAAEG